GAVAAGGHRGLGWVDGDGHRCSSWLAKRDDAAQATVRAGHCQRTWAGCVAARPRAYREYAKQGTTGRTDVAPAVCGRFVTGYAHSRGRAELGETPFLAAVALAIDVAVDR